jgi:hypothetical protein
MPHHRRADSNRMYTDGQTAHLERGLELDAADLSIKSLSDKAATKATPTSSAAALEALSSSGEAPRHDGFAPLLATCSKISSILLNLSEDIKFAIGPGRGFGELGQGEPGSGSLSRRSEERKAIAKAHGHDATGRIEEGTRSGESGVVQEGKGSTPGIAPGRESEPKSEHPAQKAYSGEDKSHGIKAFFRRGRPTPRPDTPGQSNMKAENQVTQATQGPGDDVQHDTTEMCAPDDQSESKDACDGQEGLGAFNAAGPEQLVDAHARVTEPANSQDSAIDVTYSDGGSMPEGLPLWMAPGRFVGGLGGEPRLPPWQDAATRLAVHLEQLQRVLSPSPIPLGLAVLFSGYVTFSRLPLPLLH